MSQSSNLGHLIDRQVSMWESKKGLQVERRGTLGHLAEGPWITISTQLGAGGAELAAGLGARLGWQVFDKEILVEIAKSTNTKEKVLSRLDGHAVGAFEDYVTHLFVPGDLGRSAYVLEMMRVVWAIARQGDVVMLGRGANWLLDPRYGLRVRAIAPVEKRLEWLTRTQALSPSAALHRAEEDNADRAKFTRQVYKQDIENPLGYDLVVNLGSLDLAPAVELVVAALTSKLTPAPSVLRTS
jgi:cytidylate kinase